MNKPYSVKMLAERWGVSKQTIQNQINDGVIANIFKVGKAYRIPSWEVERIESCGTESQNYTEKHTTQKPAQVIIRKENHSAQRNWV